MLIKGIEINALIDKSMSSLDERSKDVLQGRYGLVNGEQTTLAALGSKHGLTRERVRQIEFVALNEARNSVQKEADAENFVETVHHYLNHIGNVRRSDMLVRDIKALWNVEDSEEVLSSQLHFLADILMQENVIRGNNDWHCVWHNNEASYETARQIADYLVQHEKHDFDDFLSTVNKNFNLPEATILNYVSISKHFGVGPHGHLGAKHWIHVNPKTVRDKSYLVLWKSGKPMHFREIADEVNKLKRAKKAHPATVHNELIKDSRFVLVGRGMYALKGE
jgi:hypothetical protein